MKAEKIVFTEFLTVQTGTTIVRKLCFSQQNKEKMHIIFLLFPASEKAGYIAENITGSRQHCVLNRPEHLGRVLPLRVAEEQDPGLLQQDPPYPKG
jgi:hypothetical protein